MNAFLSIRLVCRQKILNAFTLRGKSDKNEMHFAHEIFLNQIGKRNKKRALAENNLCSVYGNDARDNSIVRKCLARFRSGG